MTVACLVFAKPPRPGEVKTRLAVDLGVVAAARIAAALLADTVRVVRSVPGLAVVLATPDPAADHGVRVEAWDQGGGDLGQRLERTLRRALDEHDAVLVVGADAPHVPASRYTEAMRSLASTDAVLGPTEDGGFYLLGLTRCPEGLLRDLPWSSEGTAEATLQRLGSHGFDVAVLSTAFDVDVLADLNRFRAEVPPGAAPDTHAALDALKG